MKCRACNNNDCEEVIDMGTAPPSNAFLAEEQLNCVEGYYPLKLYVCKICWLVQTLDQFPADELFVDDYPYFSSYSSTFLNHCEDYCKKILSRFEISSESKLLEIASNDGYLQDIFKKQGFKLIGVEPTKSAANIAKKKGHEVHDVFFGTKLGLDFANQKSQFDLIIANNVFAHVPDINDFALGIKKCLTPNGIVTIENPSVMSLVNECLFDTIYHEHYSYLSLKSVINITKKNGLKIFDVDKISVHGGSIRYYLTHTENDKQSVSENVLCLQNEEYQKGVEDIRTYMNFAQKCNELKNQFCKFVYSILSDGKSLACYGAAAKGNTFLNYCGLGAKEIDFIVDKNPQKWGKYAPGSRIKIQPIDALHSKKPDFIIILPWNLKTEIIHELKFTKNWGAKLVCAIPNLEIVS